MENFKRPNINVMGVPKETEGVGGWREKIFEVTVGKNFSQFDENYKSTHSEAH